MQNAHNVEHTAHNMHQPGYEMRDVSAGTLAKWIILLFSVLMGTSAATLVFYLMVVPRAAEKNVYWPLSTVRRLPPAPRVQARPIEDIHELRQSENIVMGSYGWIDPKRHVLRIPIARAMDLIEQRGIPVPGVGRSTGPAPTPTNNPGAATAVQNGFTANVSATASSAGPPSSAPTNGPGLPISKSQTNQGASKRAKGTGI